MEEEDIARQLLVPENGLNSQIKQMKHRLDLVQIWQDISGSQSLFSAAGAILDIGCGQGDQTAALAARSEASKVIGIDPGPPDYGAPFTLAQAQDHLLRSQLGPSIKFYHGDALSYLASAEAQQAAVAVLAHSLWYFPDLRTLKATFKALREPSSGVQHLCLAEWALQISTAAAVPHLLSVIAQTLPLVNPPADYAPNVRLALSPSQLIEAAKECGWCLKGQNIIKEPDLLDGSWEVYAGRSHMQMIQQASQVELQAATVISQAVEQAKNASKVACMDVWAAVFVPK